VKKVTLRRTRLFAAFLLVALLSLALNRALGCRAPAQVQFAYYPSRDQMRVAVAVPMGGGSAGAMVAVVRRKGDKTAINTVRFDRLTDGAQELTFSLPPLEGDYELVVRPENSARPEEEVVRSFTRTRFPWEGKGLGTGTRVYPPFTPLRLEGKQLSAVLREHTLNDQGLCDQIVAAGKPLLAAPMRFRVRSGGSELPIQTQPLKIVQRADHQVIAESHWTAGPLSAQSRATWEYDGVLRMDLTLAPSQGRKVDALQLDIPLREETAQLLKAFSDDNHKCEYASRVPSKAGVAWDSREVVTKQFPPNFCAYIYVGSPVRGLCWFAENDKGWSWDAGKPNIELVREGGAVTLRVHLINRPLVLEKARTLTFGLQAAPVKPQFGPWRYRFWRDRYSIVADESAWFGLGLACSYYPAGKDLSLWDAVKQANQKPFTDAEVAKIIERARPYSAPFGEAAVRRMEVGANYILKHHAGRKLLFYYNRAIYPAAEEYQTFQDEWGLTDYRTPVAGDPRQPLYLIPTDSYMDFALYWFGKSFEHGGNLGVYMDILYPRPSVNPVSSASYRREDGSLMPSTQVWQLREYMKRCFQLLNERGMPPLVMGHMTQFGMLPLLSFCTVQYDWERFFSQGDYQDRFSREYTLLVANGYLAGCWPVLLPDRGPLAQDEWTQRTFAGTSVVHEMEPYILMSKVRLEFWNPIFALVDNPDVQVYRYWEERPQPVKADHPDLPGIVYSVPGRETVYAVTSYAGRDLEATVQVDPAALGFTGRYTVLDRETRQKQTVTNNQFRIAVKKHAARLFRILPGDVQ
jgi:hypothetical protein